MPQTHVPVLAGELIEALDPQPGQIAVDCTLGGAGRARGFSCASAAPLTRRRAPDQPLPARAIVNPYDRRRLARLLRQYGEERFADRIAGEIVRRRQSHELTTTFELNDAITAAVPAP